jgi:L-threonylcarbamoyladenylate synthase
MKNTLRLSGEAGVAQVVELLRAGECVALPTETVYGLAADASNETAVNAIFEAKGRPTNHPLIVHLASVDQLKDWAAEVPPEATSLAAALWPGPLTLLLHKASSVTPVVTGGHDTIAVRAPEHPLFKAVLSESKLGLAAPSANRYKKLSPTTAEQVLTTLDGRIAAVLDGGPCEFGLESTIVDLTTNVPRVVRSGPISRQQIETVLGCDVAMPESHNVAVPGNVEAHYQPNARLHIVEFPHLSTPLPNQFGVVLHSDAAAKLFSPGLANVKHLTADPANYAKGLYAALHELDALQVGQILVEKPPLEEDWAAINDRLKRAAGP